MHRQGFSGRREPVIGFDPKIGRKNPSEILEQDVQDYLGRDYFERKPKVTRKGYRNGYESTTIKTAEGKMTLEVPQFRNTE